MNIEFFERLYADTEFCAQLGQVTLAAGRFESNLRAYLNLRDVNVSQKSALGPLIKELENNKLLSENGIRILRGLKEQRNYLTHSLFDLFAERIEETLLPRTDLIPIDVTVFTEKAWGLEQNLSGLNQIVEEAIAELKNNQEFANAGNQTLFRP